MVEAIVGAFLSQGNLVGLILLGGIIIFWKELRSNSKDLKDFSLRSNEDLKDLIKIQEENMKEVTKVLSKSVTLIEVIKDYVLIHDKREDK